jgi:hypothetical protein
MGWLASQCRRYIHSVLSISTARRAFSADIGELGVAPEAAKIGDLMFVLCGLDVPFALRKRPDGKYILLGEVHLHGFMDGGGMDGSRSIESFEIC